MSHVDVPQTMIGSLVDSLTALDRQLEPSTRADYCARCNVPEIAPNGDFSSKLLNARTAVEAGRWIDALEAASQALNALRLVITQSAEPGAGPEVVETFLERLYFPMALRALRAAGHTWYVAALALLFLDRRGQEWNQEAAFPDRLLFLLGQILARSIGHVTRQSANGDEPEPEFEWPLAVVDALGFGALAFFLWKGEKKPHLDYWFGYGFDPSDPAAPTLSERLAARSLSVWWEEHPELEVREENYAVASPAAASPARAGLSFLPLLEEHGGPFVLPVIHAGFALKTKRGDWDIELAPADISVGTGSAELKITRARGGNWFSLGNASKEGPNAFLAAKKVEIVGKVKYDLTDPGDFSRCDASVAFRLKKIQFSLGNPGGLKLLERALPEGLGGDFDLGVVADARSQSIYFEGGMGVDVYAPLHWKPVNRGSIGIEIPHVRLRLKAQKKQTGTKVIFEASLGLRLRLGPVELLTDGLGVGWNLERKRGEDGNMGPFSSDWDLLAPDAFGLVVDAKSVKGEGFIARDELRNRWMGALSLEFSKWTLAGVAMVEGDSVMGALWVTRLGVSTPIGTFEGIGLFLGIGRRGDREALLDSLKTGSLDSILFPADPVLNAPTILTTMAALMPRAEGYVTFGLMVQWVFGNLKARLVVVEAALLLEFEGKKLRRVYLLGQGKGRLSRLPAHIFSLNIELFGVLDFEKDELLIKASLRNSKLAGGDLTGDGLIYIDGDQGILSLGGFNPRYPAPSKLPPVRRLTANIADRENFKLVFTAYLAITTSSIQVGGSAYVWAGAHGFSIEGYLKVDLLARFNGEFAIDVEFEVSLKRGSRVLASIYFKGTFSGISKWRLAGKAKFSVLFLSVSVPVSFELGGAEKPIYEPVDAIGTLVQALEDQESWSAMQAQPGFTLRGAARTGVWIPGNQTLRVNQTAVPFRQLITRIGASPLSAPREFAITKIRLGGQEFAFDPVEDNFAPGLYMDVDLEEAVRAPQFERMQSGARIRSPGTKVGGAVDGGGAFEEQVLDEPPAPLALPPSARDAILALDSVAAAEADYYRVAAQPIRVEPRRYLVTYTTLEPLDDMDKDVVEAGLNYTQARVYQRTRTMRLQVVRRYEVNAQ